MLQLLRLRKASLLGRLCESRQRGAPKSRSGVGYPLVFMRAAPLTPQTRESTLASGVAALAAASRKLAAVEAQQASREAAIQELCNSVWAVEQKQYSVSGKCGEAQQYTVTHQYTQNLAAISAPKFAALRAHMRQHLQFAVHEQLQAQILARRQRQVRKSAPCSQDHC